VWLVKDSNGPLEAGGKPRLPAGRQWPRAHCKLLAYLLSIDTSLLPEWSPLPRDSGELLLFVGGNICEIVIAGRTVRTHETEPALEEYLSGEPTAGEVLERTRFRLEEGLHAGMPTSWSPTDDQAVPEDEDLVEALKELNRALRPENSFGRLFGHHEWWSDADPVSITKYSYLDVNGYPEGWYQNLDGSVDNLQLQLERARAQKPLVNEQLPLLAESVVQACEKWVAAAEGKVADRQETKNANVRKKVKDARTTLVKRRKRWQEVKTAGAETANRALEELIDSASQIDRDMDHIPITDDPEEFNAQVKAMEESDEEKSLQWSQRAMTNLKDEAQIRKEYAHDPEALEAAMTIFQDSKRKAKTAYSELLKLLTPMQYACQRNDCNAIRTAWNDYEEKLNECAPQLKASELSTALHWRLQGYQSLMGWSRHGWIDPKAVAGKIAAIQWWQADVQKHETQLAYWRPLLVLDSDGGPYFWGDAGWAIILADQREVGKARLGRLAVAVDVS